MSSNIAYCSASPEVAFPGGTATPSVLVSGFIMASDGSPVPMPNSAGASDPFSFTVHIPLGYKDSLESVKDKIVPAVQTSYGFTGDAKVVIFPNL